MKDLPSNVHAASGIHCGDVAWRLHAKKLGVLFSIALSISIGTSWKANGQTLNRAEDCLPIDGSPLSGAATHFDLPLQKLESLKNVYDRISSVAKIQPALFICDDPKVNAFAEPLGSRGKITVYTGLIQKVASDSDVLARIVGHEFAHLRLDHPARDERQRVAESIFLPQQVVARIERGSDIRTAIKLASLDMDKYLAGFRRNNESDADELGFVFSTIAGFSLDAGLRLAELLAKNGSSLNHSYLDDHPGVLQRYENSALLEENEVFRRQARTFLRNENADSLGAIVAKWTQKYNDSGAAFFYKSLWLSASGHPIYFANTALEDSVEKFAFPSRGKIISAFQPENLGASSLLCTSLISEGKTIEALNCLQRLPRDAISQAVKGTKLDTNLIVGTAAPDVQPALWSAQGADGIVYITNDDFHKDSNYMRPVQQWRAPRLPLVWGDDARNLPSSRIANTAKRQFADIFDAARSGTDADVYEKLLAGADINKTELGITPLSTAVLAGNRGTVEYLLKAGADKNVRDGFNRTAMEYALRTRQADIIEALSYSDLRR